MKNAHDHATDAPNNCCRLFVTLVVRQLLLLLLLLLLLETLRRINSIRSSHQPYSLSYHCLEGCDSFNYQR